MNYYFALAICAAVCIRGRPNTLTPLEVLRLARPRRNIGGGRRAPVDPGHLPDELWHVLQRLQVEVPGECLHLARGRAPLLALLFEHHQQGLNAYRVKPGMTALTLPVAAYYLGKSRTSTSTPKTLLVS